VAHEVRARDVVGAWGGVGVMWVACDPFRALFLSLMCRACDRLLPAATPTDESGGGVRGAMAICSLRACVSMHAVEGGRACVGARVSEG
jgi:hypothetical protein